MGFGMLATGSAREYLNLPPTERMLLSGCVKAAKVWELEQIAEMFSD